MVPSRETSWDSVTPIMKFLFVQSSDRLLEAKFQAWLEHSRDDVQFTRLELG
jgi:hypothetical protein